MSRRRKYSDEFRLKLVKEYLSGKSGGFEILAKKYGVPYSGLKMWVHLYEKHDLDGLRSSRGSYSGKFKVSVVEYMHMESMSLSDTATHFCIPSVATVAKWERIYYEEGRDSLLKERRGRRKMGKKKVSKARENINENEDLLAEVQYLRMENEYLKKLNALVLEREKAEQKKK